MSCHVGLHCLQRNLFWSEGLKGLRGLITPASFPAILYNGDIFMTSFYGVSLHQLPFYDIKLFPFSVDPFSKGKQNIFYILLRKCIFPLRYAIQ